MISGWLTRQLWKIRIGDRRRVVSIVGRFNTGQRYTRAAVIVAKLVYADWPACSRRCCCCCCSRWRVALGLGMIILHGLHFGVIGQLAWRWAALSQRCRRFVLIVGFCGCCCCCCNKYSVRVELDLIVRLPVRALLAQYAVSNIRVDIIHVSRKKNTLTLSLSLFFFLHNYKLFYRTFSSLYLLTYCLVLIIYI